MKTEFEKMIDTKNSCIQFCGTSLLFAILVSMLHFITPDKKLPDNLVYNKETKTYTTQYPLSK